MEQLTHNELRNTILIWLSSNGFFAWPVNALVGRALTNDKILKSNGNGESDIFAIQEKSGRFWAIEVKVGRDKLRPKQVIFGQQVEKRGGVFVEARSLHDVIMRRDLETNLFTDYQPKD